MAYTPEVIKEILNRLTSQPGVITPADTRHEEYPDTSGAGEDEGDAVRENQNQSNQFSTNDATGENQNQSNQSNQSNTKDAAPPPGESDREELRRSHRLKLKVQRIMRQKAAGGMSLSKISVKRAIQHDPKRAAEAIHKEMEQMLEGKKVFTPVKRSDVPHGLVIRSHMFLKYKYDAQGKLEKLKASSKTQGLLSCRWQRTRSRLVP